MKRSLMILWMFSLTVHAQYWQQQADYKMNIDVDVETYQYRGTQKITYKNNSPETLTKVYYHLYNNAFQPNSAMDIKVQETKDPDRRMVEDIGTKSKPKKVSRISLLKPDEQGYLKIEKLHQKGVVLKYHVEGTVLEVVLAKPLKSGKKTCLEMEFTGQVPLQVRRSGRNNKEGVALSMTQWYPKLAAYDAEGWHANPYLGAEFYADWGNYEVDITIDKTYTIGGTGYLQNPEEVGHGYQDASKQNQPKIIDGKITWKFKASNIHDFSWAADKEYQHIKKKLVDGPVVHLLYKNTLSKNQKKSWEQLPDVLQQLFDFYKEKVGAYPYKQYSVIQGGDGGMEYAMCTLITGKRKYRSLVGVVAHELAHSWFQFLLATNETKYAWLDEGFTTYISTLFENKMFVKEGDSFEDMYKGYAKLVSYGIEEPMTTHGDAFNYNYGYGVTSYTKGALFLCQLGYLIGKKKLQKALQNYFKKYAFKHPTPNDFVREAEKVSGMELDWYYNFWTQTTATIDYEVFSPLSTKITLHKKGKMPMPVEVKVTYVDATTELFYIPLDIMRGKKQLPGTTLLSDWAWPKSTYSFEVSKEIDKVELDPNSKIADVDLENNKWFKNNPSQ